jgi:hypothetical protein
LNLELESALLASSDHNCSTAPQHKDSMCCCFFAMVVVQNEEIKSWGAESDAEVFEIPVLQLASFAAVLNERHVPEMMNHHRTSGCFLGLQCASSSSCVP